MPITQEELDHLCRLAHLGLTPEESEHMREEISGILDHIAVLREVDTDGVPLTAFAVPLDTVLREDVVRPSWAPGSVLANAPRQEDGLFEVQAIFD
jgi:aspartyl-tRNA(Asn)/glutamyl-tRNA(Gln) amidotransferase subunit C